MSSSASTRPVEVMQVFGRVTGRPPLVEQVVSLLSYRYPDQGRRRPSNFAAALSFLAWRRA